MGLLLAILYGFGGLICLLGFLFGMFTLYIAYVHRKYSHIPSPKMPSFFTGHLPDLMRFAKQDEGIAYRAAVNYWLQGVNSHTFVVFLLSSPALTTVDPDVIKDVVMNTKNKKPKRVYDSLYQVFGARFMGNGLASVDDYDLWKSQRKVFEPAFSKGYLKTLVGSFTEITQTTIDELKLLADGKTIVPLRKYIFTIAANTISKVAFGTDFSKIWTAESLGVKIPNDTDLFGYLVTLSNEGILKTFQSAFPTLNEYLHPIEGRKYKKVVLALRKIGRDCIMKRIKMIKNGEEAPKDILTLMLSDETENLGIEELVDNFVTFYVAGLDTTAILIIFTILLLYQHPNVLERVLQEIDEVLGDETAITDEDLDQLKYMEQVFYESLRIYPSSFGLFKTLHSETKLGGYLIPAGTDLMLMNSNTQLMSEYFDNPDDFNPDRFDPNNQKPSSFVYFPFGLGHRSCIGKHFALREAKTVLVKLLTTFNIQFPENFKIEVVERGIPQPKGDLLCTLTLKKE